jgi:crotonyl-CoA carboxylase/reductase
MKTLDIGEMPELGELPEKMKAMVIRPERVGEPAKAMRLEELPVPQVGPNDVLVLVMAAGVNFNDISAARGSVFNLHKDDFHIPGSDASGIVWKVGSNVRRWKVGDEVVIHCNASCGECPECSGLDPLSCSDQRIWGYETNYGAFAQFTRVQSQQLLPKPKHLSWQEAASYGTTYFTAYHMLVHQAHASAGDWVLVWGAAGGLGIFAVQLCKLLGANAIGVVSSSSKGELVKRLGARGYINRTKFDLAPRPNETPEQVQAREGEMRRFCADVRNLAGGKDVDIVFEHVGRETFPTSVAAAKRAGKIVICGATSGHNLDFDVRQLWMRQKSVIGSRLCDVHHAERANQLVMDGRIQPVVDQVFPFNDTAAAHGLMADNGHAGKLVVNVQATATAHAEWSRPMDEQEALVAQYESTAAFV